MKIWCDVCDKEEASVFCSADEASLCDACNRRVHGANKLAGKHLRFSLLRPSYKESPLCDICRERRAFLFCKEDRAILCRDCDLPIHKTNEHTRNHTRFLLTGVKLSASSFSYATSSSFNGYEAMTVQSDNPRSFRSSLKRPKSDSDEIFSSPSMDARFPQRVQNNEDNYNSDTASILTSSISEYLETLPGWRVEDLLDPCFNSNGFCKTYNSQTSKSVDFESDVVSFLSEDLPFWASQILSESNKSLPQLPLPKNVLANGINEYKQGSNFQFGSAEWDDDGFKVPEISSASVKKSGRYH